MSPLATAPIQPIEENLQRRRHSQSADIKIHEQILPRIALPSLREGSLLATAAAPHVVLPAALDSENLRKVIMPRKKRPILIARQAPSKYFPIGIQAGLSHRWMNALMQFCLFIPGYRELFSYTPQSLNPFNEWIHRYFVDIEEKRILCREDTNELIHCLMGKCPHLFQDSWVANLFEVIHVIARYASPLVAIRPDEKILWDSHQELPIFSSQEPQPELLVGLEALYDPEKRKNSKTFFGKSLQKQYFSFETASCYELDAFIEYRMEEGEEGSYFTYLKIDGTWVQCFEEHIQMMRRSPSLDLPMQRGILFHYRRVNLSR